MSVNYRVIQWTRHKMVYDILILVLVISLLAISVAVSLSLYPEITVETMIIRSTALTAMILLHIILSIGPLARLHPAFLVLLYNRRHLGVTMFIVAAVHAVFSILQFHSLGNVNPIRSLFSSNVHYDSLLYFPFELFGFVAFTIIALMAVTSHDFWLKNLGPGSWKALHRFVYVAYVLLLLHVMLGTLQNEKSIGLPVILAVGAGWISVLHILAALKKGRVISRDGKGWILVGELASIPEGRAVTVNTRVGGVAVYHFENTAFAVSNTCSHQGGPIGEGKIIDGCITCPWHGYQYLPSTGCSPPPFEEQLDTYPVKVVQGSVYIEIPGE